MITSVEQYFTRVENLIWNKNVFKAVVRFLGGETLVVTDNFSRSSPSSKTWLRKFSYFFGVPTPDGEMERIFLFDNHLLYGAEGHLHPEGERLNPGDPRLGGFSPENVDLIEIEADHGCIVPVWRGVFALRSGRPASLRYGRGEYRRKSYRNVRRLRGAHYGF